MLLFKSCESIYSLNKYVSFNTVWVSVSVFIPDVISPLSVPVDTEIKFTSDTLLIFTSVFSTLLILKKLLLY